MDRETARQLLLEDDILHGGSWVWSMYSMNCGEPGCCSEEFNNVEEALNSIESYCSWDEVTSL